MGRGGSMVLDRSVQSHGRPGAAPVGDFDRTLQTGASAGEGFLGDWERERDDDGTIYYYNNRTRESQWLAPEGAYELKKLPGTVGTHALVLGPGVAPAPAKEEQAAATGRPTSAPATRRPSLAATIQSGARLMGFALASFRHQKHARENRDIMQAKADEKARAKAERVMNRARREAGATIVQDKKSMPPRVHCACCYSGGHCVVQSACRAGEALEMSAKREALTWAA